MPLPRFVLICLVAATPLQVRSLSAGDWPQILGPNRDGMATSEKIADSWPDGGPKTVWQHEVGSGFAGVAVVGDTAVVFHRVGDIERVEALDARSGKQKWEADHPAKFVPSYTSDSGPRAVPIIHKGRVFVYGALGVLRCIDLKSGKTVWVRDAFGDYSSKRPHKGEPPEGYFGIGTTPIIESGMIIVNVGGDTNGAGIVAFSLDTGKTVWKSTSERASYSSPTAATIDGTRHLIFATRFNVVSIDPTNGRERFRFPFGHTGPNVTAANPVVMGDKLFITASYNFGAVFAEIGKNGVEELWRDDNLLSSQYTTSIAHEGVLYGIDGRQDEGAATLKCFDPTAKKDLWTKGEFGYATLIAADGKLIALKTDGEIVLAKLTQKGYQELARNKLFTTTARALPALASGFLFVRDTKLLKCVDLKTASNSSR